MKELELRNPYSLEQFNQLIDMGTAMIKSGALPKSDNAYTIAIKLLAGREMGMGPIEAIKSFYFVNGVLNIFGAAVTRRVREHGFIISYKDEPNKCTATVSKGDETYVETFTFEEAQKSKWTATFKKGPDGKYIKNADGKYTEILKPGWYEGINRRTKLRYGALSMIIKTYIPEVMGSAVDITEIAEDTSTVIDGEISEKEEVIANLPKPEKPTGKGEIVQVMNEVKSEDIIKNFTELKDGKTQGT